MTLAAPSADPARLPTTVTTMCVGGDGWELVMDRNSWWWLVMINVSRK